MTLFSPPSPLAERVRPGRLDEVVGQEHLISPGKPLSAMLETGRLQSMILWGPPGVGKTTLARLIAGSVEAEFKALSAVNAGLKELREVATKAQVLQREGRSTILFLDEVHRFNKVQQDALLPLVESGLLVFIGATTENPSFEVSPALRSRARVYVLRPLEQADVLKVLKRALSHPQGLLAEVEEEALILLSEAAYGDARRALNGLELAVELGKGHVGTAEVREALGSVLLTMDKGGEAFYDLISALHKSVRASHVDAALYYLARMLEGGAEPLYLARRLVRMAVEDIGIADPGALRLALAAKETYMFLGSPEGELALAEVAIYLCMAPKSNAVYTAWSAAVRLAREHPAAEVPLVVRNAPTGLLKQLGYGSTYAYYHDDPEGSFRQPYLPKGLENSELYQATGEGFEERVQKRLNILRRRFREGRSEEILKRRNDEGA